MFSIQQIQNNWPSIKTKVLSRWNKLSEAEVEKTHGTHTSLSKLVQNRYGDNEDFDKNYESICSTCTHSSKNPNTITADFDASLGDMPERKINANYAKFDHTPNINHEADDRVNEFYSGVESNDAYSQFTTPDEFSPSHNPSAERLDIPLGRISSSATTQSTVKAAPNSSEVSSNDAKKEI